MNTIDRLASINAKKQYLDDKDRSAREEERNKIRQFTEDVLALEDRIYDLIEVGDAMRKSGLMPTVECHLKEDKRLEKYGYCHGIYADGCYHHVGFMEGLYTNKKMAHIGFFNGGACGKWNFYTNGYDVWEEYEDSPHERRTPTIYSLTKFLTEFPAFESAFYAWVDDITKI